MTGARSRSRGRVRRPGRRRGAEEAQNVYPAQDWSAIAVGSAVEVILPEGPPTGAASMPKPPTPALSGWSAWAERAAKCTATGTASACVRQERTA
jgi:hypothetical protein